MYLCRLQLQHFRNHTDRSIEFKTPVTVVVAPNAKGKTSVIEAVFLLATGNSFRAERVEEMIQFGRELGRVKGDIEEITEQEAQLRIEASGVVTDAAERQECTKLEVILTRGVVQGKKTALRLYSVNDVRRRKRDFTSNFTVVVFRPEDMRLVEGSPARRRSFMDGPLSLIDSEYERSLTTYDQALIRRNRLLQQVREREQPATVLTFWDKTLVKHGEYLHRKRQEYLQTFAGIEFPMPFTVQYQSSVITEARIAEYKDREIASGHTLIGPHKDDFAVILETARWSGRAAMEQEVGAALPAELDIASYGSRGQQRMAVLWLKISELRYLQESTNQPPLLLLDDILSELDENSRAQVLSLLKQGQAIVTTTEQRMVHEVKLTVPHANVLEL